MGNAVILILLATFGVVWGTWAHRGAWGLYRRVYPLPKGSLKGAWYWGVVLITIGLLTSFALLGMALPLLLAKMFASSEEVSVSMIAGVIVIVLAGSWLVSLNRYRATIEDHFE